MADRRYTINSFTVNLEAPSEGGNPARRASTERTEEGTILYEVETLLALFETFDVRATFFVSDTVSRIAPDALRAIERAGHEVALLSPRFYNPMAQLLRFRDDVKEARGRLQELTGREVFGFRTARFSTTHRSPAMIETLVQLGFTYSSSNIPPVSLHLDLLRGQRRAHRLRTDSGSLWELPLTCWTPLGIGIPLIRTGGGPPLSHLPTWIMARGVEGMNRHGEPALIYLDSWSLTSLPAGKQSRGMRRRARNYAPPEQTRAKLAAIFSICRFGSIRESFASRLSLGPHEQSRPYRSGIVRFEAISRKL
jgi:hypothetical protein